MGYLRICKAVQGFKNRTLNKVCMWRLCVVCIGYEEIHSIFG